MEVSKVGQGDGSVNDLAANSAWIGVPALSEASFSTQSSLAKLPKLIENVNCLLDQGKIDELAAVLIITALSKSRSPRQNEIIIQYLTSCTSVLDKIEQVGARRELKIEQPERDEFLALGEMIFVIAAADFDPALLSKLENFRLERNSSIPENLIHELTDLADTKLCEVISPIAVLCGRNIRGTATTAENAILEGSIKTIFSHLTDQPTGVVERLGTFLAHRKQTPEDPNVGLFETGLNESQQMVFARMARMAKAGEASRTQIWRNYLKQQSEEQELKQQRIEREKIEQKISTDQNKIDEKLNFILKNFSGKTLFQELEALLYLDIKINQEQFHQILNAIPLGLAIGHEGGFKSMRTEIEQRNLGELRPPAFEPIDRYIAWLALHRLDKVEDKSKFSEVEPKIFKLLEKSSGWSRLEAKYQVALKYLFHEIILEAQSDNNDNRLVIESS